ncbi:MAG: DUF1614 domain-containing protein [Sulfolobales archaeon]
MKRVVSIIGDLSVFYWISSTVSLVLGKHIVWDSFISFVIFLVLRLANDLRVPLLTLAVSSASGRLFDIVDWSDGLAIVRIRMRGGGGLRVFFSLSALFFAITLIAAFARVWPTYLESSKLLTVLVVFIISIAFYRSNSAYVKNIGIAVSIFTAIIYATLINLLVWLAIGSNSALIISVLINFAATIVGCDILPIKWAVLNNARVLVIGGLGLYDAIVLIPTVSYLASSLLILAVNPS